MSNNKGVALILVVSILAVAGIMAVSFAFTMQLELKSANNFLEATRASYIAEAGIAHAQVILKEDPQDIDSFKDKWYTAFIGGDVDNDSDGEKDSKWIYIEDENGEDVGRYAVLVRDENSLLNINIANQHNTSSLKVTEGWSPYEIDLNKFFSSFKLSNVENLYDDILSYRHGLDGEPGDAGIDDNQNQKVLDNDGIDNNADGIVDESGEGLDEPMEFTAESPYADDNAFETPFEFAKVKSISKEDFNTLYPFITSYSSDRNVDVSGNLRKNINFMDAASLLGLLEDAGVEDPFQKAVNIKDASDEDFSQSIVAKLYSALSAVNRGPIGDWLWKNGHYESDVKDGLPLELSWTNLAEGEYYIGVFGVEGEMVGDVTLNGKTQNSVRHGELLRIGAISFENGILDLKVKNNEADDEGNVVCYFSRIELYPKEGKEGFNTTELRGVEGIRINEIMVKPVISKSATGQQPGGDWEWKGSYFENDTPNGGKTGEGVWKWTDLPNGNFYVKLFSGAQGQYIGDVEINLVRTKNMMDGALFGDGKVVTISDNKITIKIQNNLKSGSTYFASIQLSQEPDAEYIELVNLTPYSADIGGWSIDGPSLEAWPASIPLGTVIESHSHLALCIDKTDSQAGISNNGISFVSVWGKENSTELHFVKAVTPDGDLLSDEPHPGGNVIKLKDSMGHIVDVVEYFTGGVPEFISMEQGDPSYIVDSDSNGIREGWFPSKAQSGSTAGLPNNNEGMKEKIGGDKTVEHNITELKVKNKNFSSVGEVSYVPLGLEPWKTISVEDVFKIIDRLTISGLRLEAEGHIVAGSEGGWKSIQRAAPLTEHFESGEFGAIGVWRWEKKDGLKDGYYALRVFGEEDEGISISVRLKSGEWTAFTPQLSPGPEKSVLYGNIEIGTGSDMSTPSSILELKLKNASSKTKAAHFDYIRLDPLNKVDGKVNINTASKGLLSALPGIDGTIAQGIIDNREYGNKNGLQLGIGDLLNTTILGDNDNVKKERFKQVSNIITVHSNIYRIIVTAQVLEKNKLLAEKKIWAVFER